MLSLYYLKDVNLVHGKGLFDGTENFSLLRISKKGAKENEQEPK